MLIAVGIFAASSVPARGLPPPVLFPGQDKAIHLVVYAAFGWACARALRLRSHPGMKTPVHKAVAAGAGPAVREAVSGTFASPVGRAAVATAMALGFGITDEFHQSFVPGRAVELLDGVADLVGGFLGAVAYEQRARRGRGQNGSGNDGTLIT
ncbi:MAG TPA: VanZ family protein [Polyangia bacterium]